MSYYDLPLCIYYYHYCSTISTQLHALISPFQHLQRDKKKAIPKPHFQPRHSVLYCNLQSLLHHNYLPKRVFEVVFFWFVCMHICVWNCDAELLHPAANKPCNTFPSLSTQTNNKKKSALALESMPSFHSAEFGCDLLREDLCLFKEFNTYTADVFFHLPFCVAEDDLWVSCMQAAWNEVPVRKCGIDEVLDSGSKPFNGGPRINIFRIDSEDLFMCVLYERESTAPCWIQTSGQVWFLGRC